jgi:ParB family transcriptional regulator, chromosome partitioning protein
MTDKKPTRSALGRGLSALMSDIGRSDDSMASQQQPKQSLPVESIVPNPNQPRRDFSTEKLEELAESIRTKGVVQPLIVRPMPNPDRYEIVAGERRWRAAQIAGLHQVPVLIRSYTDEEVLEIAIIENIQRQDLNPVEEALAYRQLMDRFGHSHEQLAGALSRSRSHISNMLRLLQLPEPVLVQLREGRLSAGHARALVTSPDAINLANKIVSKDLSVRETEKLVRAVRSRADLDTGKKRSHASEKDADTKAIELDLSANLGMLVTISHFGLDEGGNLTVRYRTLEDLDFLCDVLSKIPRDVMAR